MTYRVTWLAALALGAASPAWGQSVSLGPMVVVSNTPTEVVYRWELSGVPSYGTDDGAADLLNDRQDNTWALTYTPPSNQCGAVLRTAVAIDDHPTESTSSFFMDFQIDGVQKLSGLASDRGIAHAILSGSTITNWTILTADAGDVNKGYTDVYAIVGVPAGPTHWYALDYLELVFTTGAACCPAGYNYVGEGCVHPTAQIDPAATIGGAAIVQAGAVIGASTVSPQAVIGARAVIGDGSTVGGFVGRRARIGDNTTVPDGSVLARGTEIGSGVTVLGPLTLGYGARIGDNATLGNGVVLANLAVVDGGATLEDLVWLGRRAHVGPNAFVENWADLGPDTRIGPQGRVGAGTRLRRGTRLGWGAEVSSFSLVGRDVHVEAGAYVGASSTLRAGATVGSGAFLGAATNMAHRTNAAATTSGPVIQDVVGTGGDARALMALPLTFVAHSSTIDLKATATDGSGVAPAISWSASGTLPTGWSLTGTASDVLTIDAPTSGTATLSLVATDGTGTSTVETVRVITPDITPDVAIVNLGGGVLGYADGSIPLTCNGYKNTAPAGYAVASADGIYRIDPRADGNTIDVACDMDFQGGGWTLVRRRHAGAVGWHPVNDNVRGTQSYGLYVADPLANDSFSLSYSTWPYGEYVFSTGDQARWIQVDRVQIDGGFSAITTCTTSVPITASHRYNVPQNILMCLRTGNPEDPWLSAYDHGSAGTSSQNDNDIYSMLYGENGFNGWNHHRVNRGGANVWVR